MAESNADLTANTLKDELIYARRKGVAEHFADLQREAYPGKEPSPLSTNQDEATKQIDGLITELENQHRGKKFIPIGGKQIPSLTAIEEMTEATRRGAAAAEKENEGMLNGLGIPLNIGNFLSAVMNYLGAIVTWVSDGMKKDEFPSFFEEIGKQTANELNNGAKQELNKLDPETQAFMQKNGLQKQLEEGIHKTAKAVATGQKSSPEKHEAFKEGEDSLKKIRNQLEENVTEEVWAAGKGQGDRKAALDKAAESIRKTALDFSKDTQLSGITDPAQARAHARSKLDTALGDTLPPEMKAAVIEVALNNDQMKTMAGKQWLDEHKAEKPLIKAVLKSGLEEVLTSEQGKMLKQLPEGKQLSKNMDVITDGLAQTMSELKNNEALKKQDASAIFKKAKDDITGSLRATMPGANEAVINYAAEIIIKKSEAQLLGKDEKTPARQFAASEFKGEAALLADPELNRQVVATLIKPAVLAKFKDKIADNGPLDRFALSTPYNQKMETLANAVSEELLSLKKDPKTAQLDNEALFKELNGRLEKRLHAESFNAQREPHGLGLNEKEIAAFAEAGANAALQDERLFNRKGWDAQAHSGQQVALAEGIIREKMQESTKARNAYRGSTLDQHAHTIAELVVHDTDGFMSKLSVVDKKIAIENAIGGAGPFNSELAEVVAQKLGEPKQALARGEPAQEAAPETAARMPAQPSPVVELDNLEKAAGKAAELASALTPFGNIAELAGLGKALGQFSPTDMGGAVAHVTPLHNQGMKQPVPQQGASFS